MHIGGPARFMADAHTPQELADLLIRAKSQGLPAFILGGGSNTIAHDEGYTGIVIRNLIKGVEVVEETASTITFKVGAGEQWDDFVKQTVGLRVSGIEALSLIPGTVGAAPVQNIGAYGQEVSETIVSVDVFDTQANQFTALNNVDCNFGYRDSIFRSGEPGRYGITAVNFKLFKSAPPPVPRGVYLWGAVGRGKSMLIEAGAQTNTVEEVKNAMEPLADILDKTLCGEKCW